MIWAAECGCFRQILDSCVSICLSETRTSPHLSFSPCLHSTLLGVWFAPGSFEDRYQQTKSFCSTKQNCCGSSAVWDVLGTASQSQWFLLHFCFSLQSYNRGSWERRKTSSATFSSMLIVSLSPQFLFWLPIPPALTFSIFTSPLQALVLLFLRF